MILPEMIFLYKLRYSGAQQKPSVTWIHWTLPGTFHMQLPKHQMSFRSVSPRIMYNSDWSRTSTLRFAVLDVRTLLTQSLSGVSWRTARFHSRTCPSSFHPAAADGMRMRTAVLSSWSCASCSCNVSTSQTGRPCALGHFRRTSWRCARPDT